jgi:fused signal recognition particle receptor
LARDWSDLFIVPGPDDRGGVTPDSQAARGAEDDAGRGEHGDRGPARRRSAPGGWVRRLRESMARTRQALGGEINATLFGDLDEQAWERLEEALIMADVGAATTASVVSSLEAAAGAGEARGGEALSERLIALLADSARVGESRIDIRPRPAVIMVVGVNGTGKTTTAGKLAWHLRNELGSGVLLAACDTYRAAAGEQLGEWARRAGCELVAAEHGSDPGAVAFEAVAEARRTGADVVVVDTAGRLHTQGDLMAELGKVRRVLARALPGAPHETLLTLDATTGQNGLVQARQFAHDAGVSGVVMTKLDGTARGGIALAIAGELQLPVKLIGVGEALEDLRPFDAEEFARALIAPA